MLVCHSHFLGLLCCYEGGKNASDEHFPQHLYYYIVWNWVTNDTGLMIWESILG